MDEHKPWHYATLTRADEARHLLIAPFNGPAGTELIQISGGIESSLAMGTEYETKQQADAIAQIWAEDEGFTCLARDKFAFEPLEHVKVLAARMGFTGVYDLRFKRSGFPNPNFMGEVPLSSWPGLTPRNGGRYLYALDQMRLHARPALPVQAGPIVAPTGGAEYIAFILKYKALVDQIGPSTEFLLTDRDLVNRV